VRVVGAVGGSQYQPRVGGRVAVGVLVVVHARKVRAGRDEKLLTFPGVDPRHLGILVVAGALKLTLGDDTSVVRAGEAAIVPAGQRHSVRAIEPTQAIVVDYPVRESLAGIRLR
jgi:uncharacterized protein YaiE (UPF0345 family)